MKKRNFWTSLVWTLTGVGFLLASALTETRLDGLLCGLAGGCLGSGLMRLGKYTYWNKPQNRAEYARRMEAERITQRDERSRMIRDRARSVAFLAGVYILSFSMLVFCLLDALEVPAGWNLVTLYLAAFLALEYGVYAITFQKLQEKY